VEKIAEGFYQKRAGAVISEGVTLKMLIDVIDGEELDTHVVLQGQFTVAGCRRKEFSGRLSHLINEYRI